MDKETLSNYGWIVICVLVLAVMIALAGPFGNFVADAVKSTTQGLFDTNQGALDAAGITIDGQGFNDGKQNKYNMLDGDGQTITNAVDTTFRSEADYSKFVSLEIDGNVVDPSNYTVSEGSTIITLKGEYVITITNGSHTITIVSTDGSATCIFIVDISDDTIIPVGGTYYVGVTSTATGDYTGATTTLTAGQPFPETVKDGDVYVYGDYEYRYNQYYSSLEWRPLDSLNGWCARVLDTTKEVYGTILESINGTVVTSINGTFMKCTSLTTAPIIPSGVTNLDYAFSGCTSLTDLSDFVIPSSVTRIYGTFVGCTNLTTAPTIPSSVTNMKSTFKGCTSLTTAPVIPSSVTNLMQTFYGCTSLTGTIEINSNPTEWTQCLFNTKITSVVGDTTMAASILKTKTTTTANPTA